MKTSIINIHSVNGINFSDVGTMLKQKLYPLHEITKSCERVFYLLKDGREKEAREIFPFECYLVNKYLHIS